MAQPWMFMMMMMMMMMMMTCRVLIVYQVTIHKGCSKCPPSEISVRTDTSYPRLSGPEAVAGGLMGIKNAFVKFLLLFNHLKTSGFHTCHQV
jgi:hypothetical protein